ncbi:MAG: MAPEG family protein [Burkholderiales bacterium]
MHMPQSLPALVTLAMVLWYMVTVFQVGRARTKYKVLAPATTGDPAFERAFRVQMNELENLVVFLPSMWIYAVMGNPRNAAVLGAVYLVGRIVYAVGYWSEARKRAIGYYIATLAFAVTWALALGAAISRAGLQVSG